MTTVELRDIVTEADRDAVLGLRRAPGQDRFPGSMESHVEDAITDARAGADALWTRAGADALWTSCVPGEGSPQPFYERYGIVATSEIKWDEVVLRLDLNLKDR